jgi:hypothetical protein
MNSIAYVVQGSHVVQEEHVGRTVLQATREPPAVDSMRGPNPDDLEFPILFDYSTWDAPLEDEKKEDESLWWGWTDMKWFHILFLVVFCSMNVTFLFLCCFIVCTRIRVSAACCILL